jgi:polyisoprenoid-binding protein YceI
MKTRISPLLVVGVFFAALIATAAKADDFVVDPMHACANFTISHLGLSWVQGRFDTLSGTFAIDAANPAQSSFELTVNAASVDTNNPQRDEHLRSPDFFNVKQFPAITFKSTAVKGAKDGLDVTGDLTMHGATRSITVRMSGGRRAEFPKGVQRTGYSTEIKIRRADFGMDRMIEAVGNDVYISLSFEGTKK